MNPYLHRLFDQGSFGLKPVGLEERSDGKWVMAVRIFWFDSTISSPSEATEPSEISIRDMFVRSNDNKRHNVVEHDAASHLIIHSGDEFKIILDNEDEADKMMDALKLRWAVGEICAMAGGAGRPYDDPDYDDSGDQTGEDAS